jgi:hypothetical protein
MFCAVDALVLATVAQRNIDDKINESQKIPGSLYKLDKIKKKIQL